jgi:hypothetical protein
MQLELLAEVLFLVLFLLPAVVTAVDLEMSAQVVAAVEMVITHSPFQISMVVREFPVRAIEVVVALLHKLRLMPQAVAAVPEPLG